jgi:hypothetical protein
MATVLSRIDTIGRVREKCSILVWLAGWYQKVVTKYCVGVNKRLPDNAHPRAAPEFDLSDPWLPVVAFRNNGSNTGNAGVY